MAGGDVYVSFGGDSSELEASLAVAKASVRDLTQELASMAREFVSSGASADSDLGDKMREVSARLGEAKDAASEAGEEVKKGGEGAKEGGESVREGAKESALGLEALGEKLKEIAEIVGVGFGAEELKEWVNELTEAAEKTEQDAAKLGVSLRQIQELQGFATLSGADFQEMTLIFERLQLALAKASDASSPVIVALKAVGVSAAELKAQNPGEQFETLAAAFARFADGPTKTAAAMAIFGKAGADLIPILDKGRSGVDEMREAIERAGSVTGDETIDQFVQLRETLNELSLSMSSLSQRALAPLVPEINLVAREFTSLIQHIDPTPIEASVGSFSGALTEFMRDLETFADSAKTAWDGFVADVAKAAPGVSKDLNQLADSLNSIVAAENKSSPQSDYAKGSFWNSVKGRLSDLGVTQGLGYGTYDRDQELADDRALAEKLGLLGGSKRPAAAAEPYNFGGLDSDLVKMNIGLQDIGQNADQAQKKLAEMLKLSREGAPSSSESRRPNVPALSLGGGGAGSSGSGDAAQVARATYDAQVEAAKEAAQETETTLNGQLQRHQITMAEWLQQSLGTLDKEQDAIQDAADKAIASAALTSAQKIELANREQRELAQIAQKVAQDQNKAAEETHKQWQAAFNEINSAFDSQVDGLLKGTTSWGQAFKNVLTSLTEDILKFALNWTLKQAEAVAENVAGQNALVASHVAGNATVAASDAATASAGGVAWVGSALKTLAADAASVFGGVFAFLAPLLGPAAAGPAAGASAAVMAGAGAVASADIGMWNVPSDQLAMIHHNELIMPSAEAGAFRSMLSGAANGGPGGSGVSIQPSTHFHVNAIDGAGVSQFFRSNSREMMGAVNEAVRQGAHLGMRRLAAG